MTKEILKAALSRVLKDAILSIRVQAENKVDHKQICALADMIHNLPSILDNWDSIIADDPKRLEFYIQSIQMGITEYETKYPDDRMKYSRLLSGELATV